MGETIKKSCLSTSGAKRENILRLDLREDATSYRLCYQWMGWQGRIHMHQLRKWLLPCRPNGKCNTQKYVGMSSPVYTWTWCVPSSCWCGGHGLEIPGEKYACHQTNNSHQYWRREGFKNIAKEQRRRIRRSWALLYGEGDGDILLGEDS